MTREKATVASGDLPIQVVSAPLFYALHMCSQTYTHVPARGDASIPTPTRFLPARGDASIPTPLHTAPAPTRVFRERFLDFLSLGTMRE